MTTTEQIVIEKHTVADLTDKKVRIYDYLVGKFEIISTRKGIKKAFQRNQILLNGKFAKSADYVFNGDQVDLLQGKTVVRSKFELKLDVVYEDDELAIVVKPSGLVVSGNKFKTLQNALAGNINESAAKDKLPIPLTVHRLDAQTTGLVIVAKTYSMRIALGEMFEERQISKKYVAIVKDSLNGFGVLNSNVQGKKAKTFFKSISVYPSVKNSFISLVELEPITGRKHQLRIHLSRLGFPIIGDKLYGKKGDVLEHKGLFLAAVGLKFTHPKTNQSLDFEIEIPAKFNNFISREKRWYERVNSRQK
ncbi:MAG: RluA family pseudouridine synthase [Brumimicrobium sp.]